MHHPEWVVATMIEAPGSALLVLADGVVPLDPESTVFRAMLEGWACQQRARFLDERETIEPRLALVRRMVAFTGLYPWQWTPAEAEAFIGDLRSGPRPIMVSTARSYEITLQLFCAYLTDARYQWGRVCSDRFGAVPQQVFHEWNSVKHIADYEGDPRRRPLDYDEVQALFDAADGRVEQIRVRRVKGALPAMRDAALLKTVYAFGLRRQETVGTDCVDLRRCPKTPQFGQFGALNVRFGKSSRGGPPKRRTVLLVPEMDWIVPVLRQWTDEVRPLLAGRSHPALWVTERCGRLHRRSVNEAFEKVARLAGLPAELDPHCLRYSYITHLVEFDYPQRFIQEQVGHLYASTTALYTGVSDEYRTRLLLRALAEHRDELWGEQG
ncbi:tyrosine-type recombinase/integrase [Streptomyces scabiei]|uniref:tyrosine-type recombinase/integrase n=1 Tax=Streptomyces scabiei TaxID=1930 RepID=UPI0029A6CF95|nr:tyrosine-type recombinase/integrase [Streptomyces scabiei]MDX3523290.1 tyrosine-type recombinase/integrase [Streptomyces scabiei]